MEDIFIQALVTRAQTEDGLIDRLPDDVKSQVEQKIAETEIQSCDNENPA